VGVAGHLVLLVDWNWKGLGRATALTAARPGCDSGRDDLVAGLLDRLGDRVGATGWSDWTVTRPAATSTCTPVTPGTFEISAVTAPAQWPQVIPLTA